MFEFEDSIIVRANFTTRGEEDLIITVCASQLMAESIGEGRFDRSVDRSDFDREEDSWRGY